MLSAAPANAAQTTPEPQAGQGYAQPPAPTQTPVAHELVIYGKRVAVDVMSDFPMSGEAKINGGGITSYTLGDTSRSDATASKTAPAPEVTPQSTLASCWRNWVAPGTGNWYQSVAGCSIVGTTSSYQEGYTVTIDSNTLGGACAEALGYHLVWNSQVNNYVKVGFWQSIGCGAPGATLGGNVPWGATAAVKKIMIKSTSAPVGSAGMFQ
jgi:hypothetical protein